nr:D-ribose pyranase [Cohaesibacter gelatinilyticus]
MKKSALLNSDITRVIGTMGHGDGLAIADAGLPIPSSAQRIDLALTQGVPAFLPTLSVIGTELFVEKVLLANEVIDVSPDFHAALLVQVRDLSEKQGSAISIDYQSHETFKTRLADCKAVVRTGECTPYANIILYSGVTF